MENGAEEFEISFVQQIHGNQCWLFKVYQSLKGFVSGWRRCMQEENTATSEPSFNISPARRGESKRKVAWKHALDNSMTLQCLEYIAEVKAISGEGSGEEAVPSSAITRQGYGELDSEHVVGRICGDASGLAWSILNSDAREAIGIPMPPRLQEAISKAGQLPKDDPRDHFIIAIAEHMVLPITQRQWGEGWRKKQAFGTVV